MASPGPGHRFVPASLVRVRCFMNTTGRFKVEPWASAEETLDAFHDMLVRQRGNDAFWKDLRALLGSLTRDVQRRLSGDAVDNELLDPARHEALLDEIRAALGKGGAGRGAFRRLASALSAPAVAMLLLLGGTAAVGCGSTTSLEGDADVTTEPASEPATEPATEPVTDPSVDHCAEILADLSASDAECDAERDGVECLHACKSFEEIVMECVPEDATGMYGGNARCAYIDCINTMHASWRTGLEELFACWDCTMIEHKLMCDLEYFCRHPETEFDLETFLDACHCCIYLGIRFE